MRFMVVLLVWLAAQPSYANADPANSRDIALMSPTITATRKAPIEARPESACKRACPATAFGFIDGAHMSLDARNAGHLDILYSGLIGILVFERSDGAPRPLRTAARAGGVTAEGVPSLQTVLFAAAWLLVVAIGAVALYLSARMRNGGVG